MNAPVAPHPDGPVERLMVCNSSAIIAFEQIGRLWLLGDLLPSGLLVPPAVEREVAPTVSRLPAWIRVTSPDGPLDPRLIAAGLGDGETEAIALASERDLRAIIDDGDARRLAERSGLRLIGTAGLLLQARETGLIPALRPCFDDLAAVDFRLSRFVRDTLLRVVGE